MFYYDAGNTIIRRDDKEENSNKTPEEAAISTTKGMYIEPFCDAFEGEIKKELNDAKILGSLYIGSSEKLPSLKNIEFTVHLDLARNPDISTEEAQTDEFKAPYLDYVKSMQEKILHGIKETASDNETQYMIGMSYSSNNPADNAALPKLKANATGQKALYFKIIVTSEKG